MSIAIARLASFGTSRAPAKLRTLAVPLIPCACLSLLLWDRPELLISSDTLFPAEFVWSALHGHDAWAGWQLPHIPGFVPDLLLTGIVQAITGSWRLAMAVWVFVVLIWLAAIGSWLTARLASAGKDAATLAVAALLPLVISPDLFGHGHTWLLILIPYTHGGAFLLALTVAALAHRSLARHSSPTAPRLAALALLSGAATLSDQLCLFSLVAPLIAATAGAILARQIAPKPGLRMLCAVIAGAAAGANLDRLLYRQAMPKPSAADMLAHARHFLTGLAHDPVMQLVLLVALLAPAIVLWRRGPTGFLGGFWQVFAATSALGSLALTMAMYLDTWSYRYALPLLWWSFFLVAALLSEAPRRFPATRPIAMIATCLLLWPVARQLSARPVPRLFVWDSPLAACLERAGLTAGLAEYWVARPESAATDWRLQIDPIFDTGEARVWGNNRLWFAHDIHDGSRRPPYRFVVMDRLAPDRIAQSYGPPDRVLMCGVSSIWVYDDPERLWHVLVRASPLMAPVFAEAPARF